MRVKDAPLPLPVSGIHHNAYCMGLFDFFRRKPSPSPSPNPGSLQDGGAARVEGKCPFPFEIVRADLAEKRLLEKRIAEKGVSVPLILGDLPNAKRMTECWSSSFDLDSQLKLATDLDVLGWFAQAREEEAEYYDAEQENLVHPKGAAPMTSLCGGCLSQPERTDLLIASIPTTDPTTAPLHLRFGDWNACPSPHVHTALARYWRDRYGAELATIAGDIMEFTVERPPSTESEAGELAMQQYLYCNDIVSQGVGSVATLAVALRHSTRWYFWWD